MILDVDLLQPYLHHMGQQFAASTAQLRANRREVGPTPSNIK